MGVVEEIEYEEEKRELLKMKELEDFVDDYDKKDAEGEEE